MWAFQILLTDSKEVLRQERVHIQMSKATHHQVKDNLKGLEQTPDVSRPLESRIYLPSNDYLVTVCVQVVTDNFGCVRVISVDRRIRYQLSISMIEGRLTRNPDPEQLCLVLQHILVVVATRPLGLVLVKLNIYCF
jgi:hypothetical protein